eukprot:4834033-Pyramimonas_sp.AAC.1
MVGKGVTMVSLRSPRAGLDAECGCLCRDDVGAGLGLLAPRPPFHPGRSRLAASATDKGPLSARR